VKADVNEDYNLFYFDGCCVGDIRGDKSVMCVIMIAVRNP
jgi:hypothetical protein